ncbi:MAG: hypothetical protein E6H67_12590 [Betaproteobacteria bacterium]|nr:MAG: hypothetical protein E6H67_12590 [Betaproteobacteria bacterium]
MRDLEIGFFGGYHPHVVLVRKLADAADVRRDDRIVWNVGRRRMKHDHEQSGIFRDDLIDELLAVAFHRQLRVEREGQHRAKQQQRCTHYHWVLPVCNRVGEA